MVEKYTAILRKSGMRVTAARLAVLGTLDEYPHSDVDTIREEVRSRLGYISGQAVYDALNALTEAGVLRRIQPAGSRSCYEFYPQDNHHHIVCDSCNKMVDVPCVTGITPCLEPADLPQGWNLQVAELIYWGKCPDCLVDKIAESASLVG